MPDPVTGIMAATVASGAANAIGAQSAAGRVSDAASQANNLANKRWDQIVETFREYFGKGEKALQPFIDTGTTAVQSLQQNLGNFTAPIVMDQEALENTPGYQFVKTQGLRGVAGQNILRGLSGAQLKGAADFVKGLADTTYKTQFDIANINKTNAFNRLFSTSEAGRSGAAALLANATSGASALAGVGNQNASLQSGNIMAAGQAGAGADMLTARAIGDTVSSLPYAPYVANKLYPSGKFGMFSNNDATVPIGQSRTD